MMFRNPLWSRLVDGPNDERFFVVFLVGSALSLLALSALALYGVLY